MYLDAILEVAIGLVVVWFVISTAASQVQEFFADLLKIRSSFLKSRIQEMLQGKDKVALLYNHPLIQSLGTPWFFMAQGEPADIPKEIFVQAFVETFGGSAEPVNPKSAPDESNSVMQKLPAAHPRNTAPRQNTAASASLSPALFTSLLSKKDAAGNTDTKNIEKWFDAKMQEASNLYHRGSTGIAFIIGFCLAVILNVDTVHIANVLWKDPTLRQSLVAEAGKITAEAMPTLSDTVTKIDELTIPIGWKSTSGSPSSMIIGWLLTGFAVAQGAPFWFDILRKLVSAKSQQTQAQKAPSAEASPQNAVK